MQARKLMRIALYYALRFSVPSLLKYKNLDQSNQRGNQPTVYWVAYIYKLFATGEFKYSVLCCVAVGVLPKSAGCLKDPKHFLLSLTGYRQVYFDVCLENRCRRSIKRVHKFIFFLQNWACASICKGV